MHKNRIIRLEDAIRQRRDAKIDRIVDYMASVLTDDERELICSAIQRDIDHGRNAIFTQAELEASWRFDALVQGRPDILRLMHDLMDPNYANTN